MFEIKPHDAPVMTRTMGYTCRAVPADGLEQSSLAPTPDNGKGVMDQVQAETPLVCSGIWSR